MTPAANVDLAARLGPVRENLRRTLVVLDFDGTLAPIVDQPEDARAEPGALETLIALAPKVAALAVVTGRPAGTAVALGKLDQIPGIVVLGHYGLQRWHDGVLETPDPVPGVAVARSELPELLTAGVRIEDKEHSLVVHSRGLPDPDGVLIRLDPSLRALAARTGLEVVPGRYVRELRPPGANKGTALADLAARVAPGAVLVAGDDLGDLPMFAAAGRLGVPVLRVAVVSGGADPAVAAAADVSVQGQAALVRLLRALV